MSSFLTWALLVVSVFIFISTSFSMRCKNSDSYQGVLTVLLLLATKAILYGFQIFNFTIDKFQETLFTVNISITPIIASLLLLTALTSVTFISNSKAIKKIIGLLGFFFFAIILTNPLHHLAFTLTNANTLYKFGYNVEMLLNISNIYSTFCVLLSFILIAIGCATNKIKTKKADTYFGNVLMLGASITLFINASFDVEAITCFILAIILYGYVYYQNDFNIIPLIKDHTFELLDKGVLVVNNDFIIKDYNSALEKLFSDINFDNVKGKKIDDVFRFYPVVIYSIKNSKRENISIDGKNYSLEIFTSVEKRQKNVIHTLTFNPAKAFSVFDSMTKSNTLDPLTHLKTKDKFIEMIEFEYDNAVRYNLPFILMYIDVDNFSDIVKKYGGIAGDLLLTNLSALIKKEIRKTDILARIDNSRFALLLTHTNLSNCESVAERIRKRIEKNALAYEDDLITATISIGICGTDEINDQSIDTFISKAEDALENAKDNSKNCVIKNYIK